MELSPTTAALQTPAGRGGIAVLLLAGPEAESILTQIFQPLPSHRDAAEGLLRLGKIVSDGTVLDEAVVCRRGGAFELNIHGGPQAVRSTMELLARRGVRLLPAGTSTSESFLLAYPHWQNPRIGQEMLEALPQAASVLVASALSQQWSAGLSRLARETLAGITKTTETTETTKRREIETTKGKQTEFSAPLRRAGEALATMTRLLNPAEVVIVGPPNAGKSTLMNVLVGRPVSIVHEQAGTTRDWVRELALVNQVPIHLTDTAGLWEEATDIDAEAVRRAVRCACQGDLVLLTSCDGEFDIPSWLAGQSIILVWTKADLLHQSAPPNTSQSPRKAFRGVSHDRSGLPPAVAVSALTGEGMEALKQAILDRLGLADMDPTAPMAFTPRQADLLAQAADALTAGDAARASQALHELLGGSGYGIPA